MRGEKGEEVLEILLDIAASVLEAEDYAKVLLDVKIIKELAEGKIPKEVMPFLEETNDIKLTPEKIHKVIRELILRKPHPSQFKTNIQFNPETFKKFMTVKYLKGVTSYLEYTPERYASEYLAAVLMGIFAWNFANYFKPPEEVIAKVQVAPQDRYEILDDDIFEEVSRNFDEKIYAKDFGSGRLLKNVYLLREKGRKYFSIVIEEDLNGKKVLGSREINLGVIHRKWESARRYEEIKFFAQKIPNPKPYHAQYSMKIIAVTKSNGASKIARVKAKFLVDAYITKDGQWFFKAKNFTIPLMDPVFKSPRGGRIGDIVYYIMPKDRNPEATLEELEAFLGETSIAEKDMIEKIYRVPNGKKEGYLVIFDNIDKVHLINPGVREINTNKSLFLRKVGGEDYKI